MNWTERLNCGPGRVPLGQGTAELLNWAYQKHLADNRPHRHTFFEVCQVGSHGHGRFLVEGCEHPLTPGTVFIARPGVVHQIVNTAEPGMELFWVCFQWTPAAGAPTGEVDHLMQDFAEAFVVAADDAHGRLAAQWQAVGALTAAGARPGSGVQVTAQVTALLLTIAQIGAGAQTEPTEAGGAADLEDTAARLAVRYIHDNLNRPLSVSEIAGQVHTSPRHLFRLFQRFTGVSPAAYIVRARIDRAAGLLVHTQMPIKQVSEVVGMPDVHHFTRVFARQVGCPPGEYRRSAETRPVPNIQKPGDLV